MNWTQVVGNQRPNMVCTVTMLKVKPSQIKVSVMIDIGADITIISANTWPLLHLQDLPLLALEGSHRAA